jgi:hypothetical protein
MTIEETLPERSGKHRYFYTVNTQRFESSDGVQDGRKILRNAGFDPPDEHILIEVLHPGTLVVGLDEDVELDGAKEKEFRAFLSDRTFAFTIDERGYEWGAATIAETELRYLGNVPANKVLVLDRHDEPDLVLDEGASLDLNQRGTEHLLTEKRLITVYYKDQAFEVKRGTYTGAQLCAIFGVPVQYILDLVKPNGDFEEIGQDQPLRVKDGMHFVSHPPRGHSS